MLCLVSYSPWSSLKILRVPLHVFGGAQVPKERDPLEKNGKSYVY